MNTPPNSAPDPQRERMAATAYRALGMSCGWPKADNPDGWYKLVPALQAGWLAVADALLGAREGARPALYDAFAVEIEHACTCREVIDGEKVVCPLHRAIAALLATATDQVRELEAELSTARASVTKLLNGNYWTEQRDLQQRAEQAQAPASQNELAMTMQQKYRFEAEARVLEVQREAHVLATNWQSLRDELIAAHARALWASGERVRALEHFLDFTVRSWLLDLNLNTHANCDAAHCVHAQAFGQCYDALDAILTPPDARPGR